MAKADPVGTTCPLGAHIRKVNTRDAPSDMGANSATYDGRLLRVGVPFGAPLPDTMKYATDSENPEGGNRGLLFLSIQASIVDQFEFLQSRWINDETRPKMPGGNDMIVGQNTPAREGNPSLFPVRNGVCAGRSPERWSVRDSIRWGIFFRPVLVRSSRCCCQVRWSAARQLLDLVDGDRYADKIISRVEPSQPNGFNLPTACLTGFLSCTGL